MPYLGGIALSWFLLSAHPTQATTASGLLGDWVLPDGSAIVRIEASGKDGELKGRVRALLRPHFSVVDGYGEVGQPRQDIRNSDKSAHNRPVVGLEIATELRFEDESWWGQIYDPGSGKSYRCRISLVGADFARVRGYIGFSVIGRTMHWQRLPSYTAQMLEMLAVSLGDGAAGE